MAVAVVLSPGPPSVGGLWRPVYGLRQAPREWHDTLRITLAALGFTPSTADPSMFLLTDTSLSLFEVLVYVLQRFGSSPQPTSLSTGQSLSAPPSDESVEPSGPYPELVGFLMYLMTCTRPDLAYPLRLLARYVAPVRRAWGSCLEDGVHLSSPVTQTLLGLPARLRFLAPVVRLRSTQGHGCTGATLAHLPADRLGRAASFASSSQRGQLRLAYVATRTNTADIFTKALPPGDHQRFSTVLGLVPTLPHFLYA
ncbi:unnamed protein product [Closterium sp. NIES-53]